MRLGALDQITLAYTGRSFVIIKIINISTSLVISAYDPFEEKKEVQSEILYEQTFEKCSFVELNKLIKNCKRIFGNKSSFDDLLENLRKFVEFEDFLEII
jgi:hypothetical protein